MSHYFVLKYVHLPLSKSQRMLIGLSRACSHRHDTKETAPTLTAHISAVSVLPVLETGLSRIKSGPDLGERPSLLWEGSLTGVLVSKSNILLFRDCSCNAINEILS